MVQVTQCAAGPFSPVTAQANEAIDADKTTLILKVHSHALTSDPDRRVGQM